MKKILFLLLLGLAALSSPAQDAGTCFVQMPDSLLPLLTAVNRADCIDFLANQMKAEVTNRLEGKSEMTRLTADYIHLQMTPQSTWQMKLLPLNDSTSVICTVATVCAPACDSRIRFYSTAWEELPADSFLPARPTLQDFIAEPADTTDVYSYRDARRQADILLIQAELSADEPTLLLLFTTPDYMEREAAETLKPYLREGIRYRWEGGSFFNEK